ncbi:MAG TPA: hypothetical protein DDZ78_10530, partial [Porphyromonadaceae bacterium]|nr:hypothetical protein [Porphyromonadaceae bacterium]
GNESILRLQKVSFLYSSSSYLAQIAREECVIAGLIRHLLIKGGCIRWMTKRFDKEKRAGSINI